jgi:apolipoprotein D and lipocalin family protein
MNNRIGMGFGKGRGYYNLIPKDSYVHSLSAKGIKIKYVPSKVLCDYAGMNNYAARQIHFHPRPKKNEVFIDRELPTKDKEITILHEMTELDLMRHGYPYWSAHKIALKQENKLYAKLVDLKKYQGKWYNQASIPNWFDKECKGQTAEYTLRPDNKVDVVNTCLPSKRQVKGVARSVSKDNKNLKVSFFPFIEGDYNILYLDSRYKNAIVGSSSKDYLWILTRKKNLPKKELDRLVNIAKDKGYDTFKLKFMTLKASNFPLEEFMFKDGKNVWEMDAKANIQTPTKITQELKTPTVELLPAKTFDTKFKDDYEEYEQGYATTKISPDGTTKVFVRDDGNNDYTKEGKLLMHELKEIEIFKDLVNNKGINPNVADEMAHNLNPVKIEGVSDQYPIDPNN